MLALALLFVVASSLQPPHSGLEAWPDNERVRQLALEDLLLGAIEPDALRSWHDSVASTPHDAGTEGDRQVVEFLAKSFEEFGLEVEVQELTVLLARPVEAELELVAPEQMTLPVRERALLGDPFTSDSALRPGWNAYSGSGEVEGEVVYANYGRVEDFELLRERGVDCTGKVVLARYGGNYRGYKAKFAEAAGAAGLVIFTDPADSGYGRGLPYPEGGYANETSIQRGSIKTLPYYGDPTTPFVEATPDAERIPVDELALPRIPVQPVGWGAAQEILSRMRGESVPREWQGGLPFRYRLTGEADVRVRLRVVQERTLMRTQNVLGTLVGAVEPERRIVLGAHHDAWGHGASDPTCGLICVVEAARAWAKAAEAGQRPRRSITFAGWGAEEYGIIGSVEYVESRLAELKENAVAYLNFDAAATGPRFRASSSPSLQRAIAGAATRLPPADGGGSNVFSAWLEAGPNPSDPALPRFGTMGGGGSDHVGFVALAGVPCAGLHGSGAEGSAYHSAYDTLSWYRKVVGDDYESARMVTGAAVLVSARLANAPLLPLDPARLGPETRRHLRSLTQRGRETGLFDANEAGEVAVELSRIDAAARQFEKRARAVQDELAAAVAAGSLGDDERARANALLMGLDRVWLDPAGVPGRPWYRNLYGASDENSGYAAWMLPALRHAIEHVDGAALRAAERRYLAVFERGAELLEALALLTPSSEER